jgi:hypothetical protein
MAFCSIFWFYPQLLFRGRFKADLGVILGLRFLDHCFGFVSSARRVVFHTSGAGCSKLDYSANPGLKFNLLF